MRVLWSKNEHFRGQYWRTFSACGIDKGMAFLETARHFLEWYDIRVIVFVCNSLKLNASSNRLLKASLL
jgi:hypothetical protein